MHTRPGRPQGGGKIGGFFRKPGTGHSPQNETEIQLSDQEKLAEDVETEMLRTWQDLAIIIRGAAHHTPCRQSPTGPRV